MEKEMLEITLLFSRPKKNNGPLFHELIIRPLASMFLCSTPNHLIIIHWGGLEDPLKGITTGPQHTHTHTHNKHMYQYKSMFTEAV